MAIRSQAKKTQRAERKRPNALNALRDDVRALKREIIINTATDLFYERGYDRTSVDDLAAAMSVTKTVIYYNFKSKEEVLESIIDRTMSYTREAIDRGVATGRTPAERLALISFLYADHILKHKTMLGVYFREERSFSDAMRRRIRVFEKAVDEKVAEVIDAGIASGEFRRADARLMSLTITGMISMAFHWHRENERFSHEVLCRHFAEQALRLVGHTGTMALEQAPFVVPTP